MAPQPTTDPIDPEKESKLAELLQTLGPAAAMGLFFAALYNRVGNELTTLENAGDATPNEDPRISVLRNRYGQFNEKCIYTKALLERYVDDHLTAHYTEKPNAKANPKAVLDWKNRIRTSMVNYLSHLGDLLPIVIENEVAFDFVKDQNHLRQKYGVPEDVDGVFIESAKLIIARQKANSDSDNIATISHEVGHSIGNQKRMTDNLPLQYSKKWWRVVRAWINKEGFAVTPNTHADLSALDKTDLQEHLLGYPDLEIWSAEAFAEFFRLYDEQNVLHQDPETVKAALSKPYPTLTKAWFNQILPLLQKEAGVLLQYRQMVLKKRLTLASAEEKTAIQNEFANTPTDCLKKQSIQILEPTVKKMLNPYLAQLAEGHADAVGSYMLQVMSGSMHRPGTYQKHFKKTIDGELAKYQEARDKTAFRHRALYALAGAPLDDHKVHQFEEQLKQLTPDQLHSVVTNYHILFQESTLPQQYQLLTDALKQQLALFGFPEAAKALTLEVSEQTDSNGHKIKVYEYVLAQKWGERTNARGYTLHEEMQEEWRQISDDKLRKLNFKKVEWMDLLNVTTWDAKKRAHRFPVEPSEVWEFFEHNKIPHLSLPTTAKLRQDVLQSLRQLEQELVLQPQKGTATPQQQEQPQAQHGGGKTPATPDPVADARAFTAFRVGEMLRALLSTSTDEGMVDTAVHLPYANKNESNVQIQQLIKTFRHDPVVRELIEHRSAYAHGMLKEMPALSKQNAYDLNMLISKSRKVIQRQMRHWPRLATSLNVIEALSQELAMDEALPKRAATNPEVIARAKAYREVGNIAAFRHEKAQLRATELQALAKEVIDARHGETPSGLITILLGDKKLGQFSRKELERFSSYLTQETPSFENAENTKRFKIPKEALLPEDKRAVYLHYVHPLNANDTVNPVTPPPPFRQAQIQQQPQAKHGGGKTKPDAPTLPFHTRKAELTVEVAPKTSAASRPQIVIDTGTMLTLLLGGDPGTEGYAHGNLLLDMAKKGLIDLHIPDMVLAEVFGSTVPLYKEDFARDANGNRHYQASMVNPTFGRIGERIDFISDLVALPNVTVQRTDTGSFYLSRVYHLAVQKQNQSQFKRSSLESEEAFRQRQMVFNAQGNVQLRDNELKDAKGDQVNSGLKDGGEIAVGDGVAELQRADANAYITVLSEGSDVRGRVGQRRFYNHLMHALKTYQEKDLKLSQAWVALEKKYPQFKGDIADIQDDPYKYYHQLDPKNTEKKKASPGPRGRFNPNEPAFKPHYAEAFGTYHYLTTKGFFAGLAYAAMHVSLTENGHTDLRTNREANLAALHDEAKQFYILAPNESIEKPVLEASYQRVIKNVNDNGLKRTYDKHHDHTADQPPALVKGREAKSVMEVPNTAPFMNLVKAWLADPATNVKMTEVVKKHHMRIMIHDGGRSVVTFTQAIKKFKHLPRDVQLSVLEDLKKNPDSRDVAKALEPFVQPKNTVTHTTTLTPQALHALTTRLVAAYRLETTLSAAATPITPPKNTTSDEAMATLPPVPPPVEPIVVGVGDGGADANTTPAATPKLIVANPEASAVRPPILSPHAPRVNGLGGAGMGLLGALKLQEGSAFRHHLENGGTATTYAVSTLVADVAGLGAGLVEMHKQLALKKLTDLALHLKALRTANAIGSGSMVMALGGGVLETQAALAANDGKSATIAFGGTLGGLGGGMLAGGLAGSLIPGPGTLGGAIAGLVVTFAGGFAGSSLMEGIALDVFGKEWEAKEDQETLADLKKLQTSLPAKLDIQRRYLTQCARAFEKGDYLSQQDLLAKLAQSPAQFNPVEKESIERTSNILAMQIGQLSEEFFHLTGQTLTPAQWLTKSGTQTFDTATDATLTDLAKRIDLFQKHYEYLTVAKATNDATTILTELMSDLKLKTRQINTELAQLKELQGLMAEWKKLTADTAQPNIVPFGTRMESLELKAMASMTATDKEARKQLNAEFAWATQQAETDEAKLIKYRMEIEAFSKRYLTTLQALPKIVTPKQVQAETERLGDIIACVKEQEKQLATLPDMTKAEALNARHLHELITIACPNEKLCLPAGFCENVAALEAKYKDGKTKDGTVYYDTSPGRIDHTEFDHILREMNKTAGITVTATATDLTLKCLQGTANVRRTAPGK